MNFSGIIIILSMYMFLSSLFDIDLGTNLIVAIVLFNTSLKDTEIDTGDNNKLAYSEEINKKKINANYEY